MVTWPQLLPVPAGHPSCARLLYMHSFCCIKQMCAAWAGVGRHPGHKRLCRHHDATKPRFTLWTLAKANHEHDNANRSSIERNRLKNRSSTQEVQSSVLVRNADILLHIPKQLPPLHIPPWHSAPLRRQRLPANRAPQRPRPRPQVVQLLLLQIIVGVNLGQPPLPARRAPLVALLQRCAGGP